MVKITQALAGQLISSQFPEFGHLPIQPVKIQGHDNRTFRLGTDMLVRMPTAEPYALRVSTEQEWLPKLAPHLSISIPTPIALGKPSDDYPMPWSIYGWLNGKSANGLVLDKDNLEHIAVDLSQFLKELQRIEGVDGPAPSLHNWWRGDHVGIYHEQARPQVEQLQSLIDDQAALSSW